MLQGGGLGWHDVNAPAVFFTGSAECAELPLQQDALVSAIEYSPLLGVTAMTTPWGCRSVYGYNSDGRLASIALDGIGTSESFTYSINADGGFVNTAERWLSSNGLSRHKKRNPLRWPWPFDCEYEPLGFRYRRGYIPPVFPSTTSTTSAAGCARLLKMWRELMRLSMSTYGNNFCMRVRREIFGQEK